MDVRLPPADDRPLPDGWARLVYQGYWLYGTRPLCIHLPSHFSPFYRTAPRSHFAFQPNVLPFFAVNHATKAVSKKHPDDIPPNRTGLSPDFASRLAKGGPAAAAVDVDSAVGFSTFVESPSHAPTQEHRGTGFSNAPSFRIFGPLGADNGQDAAVMDGVELGQEVRAKRYHRDVSEQDSTELLPSLYELPPRREYDRFVESEPSVRPPGKAALRG